ncbi:hypothetical protein PF005_g9493 [Phytophthora fragariae]|uniref:Uncharacterized protein n=1 Tax=Phytophthora fragariae TaxID=53985 RepID=A0A6A3YB22_9STRA|nr:hypothetical protein PF009_g10102 [Phytophthora fragariae]KAE9013623.1 hypothetical protein PF011_g8402 [Phytophthora fragariae]KAE9116556.1 hypothetical protein PF007_g9621 [Phytophthora fragariae]KAE9117669.1 hypothetical protein PF010_g8525 [Phytophthora fragariae]KAE9146441.1 hypothetical protein PF006_g8794 [Phytophthora fragariae]
MPSAKWEIARIGVYITIPVVATCIYAQPDCINYIIDRVGQDRHLRVFYDSILTLCNLL